MFLFNVHTYYETKKLVNSKKKYLQFNRADDQTHCKDTNIPRKGIARPQSQFHHSCVCERFINSTNRSAYCATGKYVDQSWENINRSQIHDWGNWDWGRAIPFRCSPVSMTCLFGSPGTGQSAVTTYICKILANRRHFPELAHPAYLENGQSTIAERTFYNTPSTHITQKNIYSAVKTWPGVCTRTFYNCAYTSNLL
jgi:hypothetical protein